MADVTSIYGNPIKDAVARADIATNTQDISDLKDGFDDLDDRVTALEEGGTGSGLTDDIKQALLQIAEKVAYTDEDGQDYYDDLYDALYTVTAISVNPTTVNLQTIGGTQQLTATTIPSGAGVSWESSNTAVATVDANGLVTSVGYGSATITATAGQLSATCAVVVAQATLTSISAVYTQSGTVYDTDTLDSLKDDLVVTAHWSNGTTSTLASADYTLSGTLTVGTSTITISYGGKTATFTVTVTDSSAIQVTYTQGSIGSGSTSETNVSGVITSGVHLDDDETLVITIASGYSIYPFGINCSSDESKAGTMSSTNILSAYCMTDGGYVFKNTSEMTGTFTANGKNIKNASNAGWQTPPVTYVYTPSAQSGLTIKGLGFLIKKNDGSNITPSEIEQIVSVSKAGVSS